MLTVNIIIISSFSLFFQHKQRMLQLNLWAGAIWLSPLTTLFYSFIFFSLVSNGKSLKGFEILPHPSHTHLALHMLKPRGLLEVKESKEVAEEEEEERSRTAWRGGRIGQGSLAFLSSIAPQGPRKCSNSKSAVLKYTTRRKGTSVDFLFQTTNVPFMTALKIRTESHQLAALIETALWSSWTVRGPNFVI